MSCGTCPHTDGCCYASMPPQVKCTITNEYHLYDDACNCPEARASIDNAKKRLEEGYTNGSCDDSAVYNITVPDNVNLATSVMCSAVSTEAAVACTYCIVCDSDIILSQYDCGLKVCTACQKAIKFIKEKFIKELEEYEVY